ncbi:MAG: DUF362 domain-containing protein [Chloroflexi bacterium]|nr:DUF362 domain-containing protein [Chloroflexota bacterium]MCH8868517.1 DUF362 domain-containing protein [Chloroflexota bacterium]MCH9039321.1 DUF362 domain-containing protein [Chloroflexota bacterium]MCI0771298.1 DUF362 domain-containing protein [Chloroflexota bacterium]MCI0791431.1 DUF362 domain-containing protein [Chloroflexota bacterium]
MAISQVYYMDGHSESTETSLVSKMLTVFDAARLDDMISPNDIVAIKVHCGEWNNTAYLRPVYARALADRIKELGGRPFVCDTTTSTYSPWGSRSNELDIMITAERNGYSSAVLGCPFICADGFIGTSDYRVDLPEGYLLKEAYVAQAIAAADVLIALTHFKGHSMGVIGGALKNLGIGAQSKRGKLNVHMGGHPKYGFGAAGVFHPEKFKGKAETPDWEIIEDCCPFDLYHINDNDELEWDRERCTTCLGCFGVVGPRGLVDVPPVNFDAVDVAIADACLAVEKVVGRDKVGYINMAIDISPRCDCANHADVPIVPHLGVFASTDAVAIDMACVDKAKEAQGIPGSAVEMMEAHHPGDNKFEAAAATFHGQSEVASINTGHENGLGSRDYTLVEVEPADAAKYRFPYDRRPSRQRFKEQFEKFQPFPYDRHDGQGFARNEEVDLERMKRHYDHSTNGHHADVEIEELQPADDN